MQRFTRDQMAARVARDIPEGAYVNLGIGLPTMVANHLPKDREILLHSENGLLGMGPAPAPGAEDPRPDQRRQAAGDAAAGRRVFPSRGFVRDDARRPSRFLRARRVPGVDDRRSRELAHRRARCDSRRRRRDGPRDRREARLRDDGAPDQAGPEQDRRPLHVSADRHRLREPHLHRPRGARRDAARPCTSSRSSTACRSTSCSG